MTLFNKGMQTFFRTWALGIGTPATGTPQCRTDWDQLQIQRGPCAWRQGARADYVVKLLRGNIRVKGASG